MVTNVSEENTVSFVRVELQSEDQVVPQNPSSFAELQCGLAQDITEYKPLRLMKYCYMTYTPTKRVDYHRGTSRK